MDSFYLLALVLSAFAILLFEGTNKLNPLTESGFTWVI